MLQHFSPNHSLIPRRSGNSLGLKLSKFTFQTSIPCFELDLVIEVDGELLDEGEEDRLGEGTGNLVKHFLWSHLMAEIHHQLKVRR